MFGKNTYLTGYFPLFAIVLFSASFGFYSQVYLVEQLEILGIYRGMTELFSIGRVQVALWFVCTLLFFMLFVELSLFFFSKESEGDTLNRRIRGGSSIFLIGSLCSIVVVQSFFYFQSYSCCLAWPISFISFIKPVPHYRLQGCSA